MEAALSSLAARRRGYEEALAEYRIALRILDEPNATPQEKKSAEAARLRFGSAKRAYYDAADVVEVLRRHSQS